MSKRSASARNRAQRNRSAAPKTFEIVHPERDRTDAEESNTRPDNAPIAASAQAESNRQEYQNASAPRSASAHLAARRQVAQRLQQRSATTLITSEHFAYVRQDLLKIAVLATVMFIVIIVLYFVFGRT